MEGCEGDVGTQPPWDVHLLSLVPLFRSKVKRHILAKRGRAGNRTREPTPPPNGFFENGHGSRARFPCLAMAWSSWTSLGAQLETETSRHPCTLCVRTCRPVEDHSGLGSFSNAEICPTWSGHGINTETPRHGIDVGIDVLKEPCQQVVEVPEQFNPGLEVGEDPRSPSLGRALTESMS